MGNTEGSIEGSLDGKVEGDREGTIEGALDNFKSFERYVDNKVTPMNKVDATATENEIIITSFNQSGA